ncbi:hypothetical protein COV16_04515 [Candidatus Woesearchaeota archaeon CG10_big_fil_rev_8_21_14_0_10_34_8]|nr:MAG: hypothetical protein COV16_04515 [Candidatus Woesearchaeota archaeon CG10_big_fil_rev_8_21_14_0_10_34_8]
MVFALFFHHLVEILASPDKNIRNMTLNIIIFIFTIIILIIGLFFYVKPNRAVHVLRYINPYWLYINRRKELILFFVVSLLCFTFLEILTQIILPVNIMKYGWVIAPNSTYTVEFDDTPNNTRNITVTYYDYGFKRWGDINTDKTKVFIIGDSFTSMNFVSNGEEYYAYLEEEFEKTEFFVYGAGGYSTLQEFMILDDFIDVIKPDIILWQFSRNDFLNNYYPYESKSYFDNNRAFRPYLEGNDVVYRIPRPLSALRKHSAFFHYLLEKYDFVVFKIQLAKIAADLTIIEELSDEKDDALNVTVQIMEMVEERAGDIPIYMFTTSHYTEYEETICQSVNITCVYGVAEEVEIKEEEGLTLRVADGHWNVDGNKVAGEFLVNYFNTYIFPYLEED